MEVFLNIAKSVLYSIAVSAGLIVPTSMTTQIVPAPKVMVDTSNTPDISPKKIDVIVVPKSDLQLNISKSTTSPIKKSEKKDTSPVVVNRVISEAERLRSSPLSSSQIFALTNKERAKYSLPPLSWNEKLAQAADIKNKDMIARKYFAHESPDGNGIEYLANATKYEYSLIGENLAMGDFTSSADVVAGWMNSPGHRANILKSSFTEIGISALVGDSNGHNVWFSTQEFGRPAPECNMPDVKLESIIKESNSYSKNLASELTKIKTNIETGNFGNTDIKTLINQYNSLVNKSNGLHDKIKDLVVTYNIAVKSYNDCIEKETRIVGSTD